jgi:hypothetical protein
VSSSWLTDASVLVLQKITRDQKMKVELKRWTRSRTRGDRMRYVAARGEYFGLIKVAKRRTWEDYAMSLKGRAVWQTMRYYTKSKSTQTTPHAESKKQGKE